MGAPPAEIRRSRQRETTRRAILDASEELLVESGYDGFSIRRLVERCGFSAPTIYHHFGDKPGLIDTLVEERFGRLLEELSRVEHHGDPAAYMCDLAHAYVGFGLRNPTHYRLFSTPRPMTSGPARSAEKARSLLEAPVRELAESGRLRFEDIDPVVQSVYALTHGIVSLRSIRPDYPWSKDWLAVGLDCLLHGALSDAPAGGRS